MFGYAVNKIYLTESVGAGWDIRTWAVRNKIESFQHVECGWHFGEGEPATPAAVERALDVLDVVAIYDLSVEAFLTASGQIVINCVGGEFSLEIGIDDSENLELTLEKGIGLDFSVLFDSDSIPIRDLPNHLDNLKAKTQWTLSGCSSSTVFSARKEDSSAEPSPTLGGTQESGHWLLIASACSA